MGDNFGVDNCRSDLDWNLCPENVPRWVDRSGSEVDSPWGDNLLVLRRRLKTVWYQYR
jgi:hypothetical protein